VLRISLLKRQKRTQQEEKKTRFLGGGKTCYGLIHVKKD